MNLHRYKNRLVFARMGAGNEETGVTAKGFRVSFWDNKNIIKYIMMKHSSENTL